MNLLNKLQRHPVITGLAAVVAGVGIFAGAMHAWGPSRATFTMANPASYVTFNAITDNPKHGDERNFVQIRNYTDNGQFGENVDLVAGKEYEVYVFYHNNASPDLNDAANNYKGIALDTRMRVQMPATVNAGENARVTGFVSASNANPKEVWDEAYGKNTTNGGMALRYVPNSAKITSNGKVNGQYINLDNLASSNGALLGYNALDGKLPGCSEYSGYVTYRFVADQPNFEITKDVSVAGANQYVDSLAATAGSKVDYKIKYKNTGTVTQEDVTIKDVLPAGVSYVAGTTMYSSSKTDNKWTPTNSDNLVVGGTNFGAFAPGGALYVKFTATVNPADKLTCGTNTFVNKAYANTPNGSKSDTATVTVEKKCEPTPVDKDVTVCEIATKKIVTIKESVYNANKEKYADKDSDKCKAITVCEISSKTVITISREQYNAHKDLYADQNSEVCKPVKKPETPETPKTPETPVVELPKTGFDLSAMSLIGAGALTYAGYAYIASRRV